MVSATARFRRFPVWKIRFEVSNGFLVFGKSVGFRRIQNPSRP